MASKNNFNITGNEIDITGGNLTKMAFATYREDYIEELTSVTWSESKGYLKNSKLGYLHRYIMKKWYGEDILKEMDRKKWIVDHMDNNGYNCKLSNLEFLPTRHNVAKGQTFDVEAKVLRHEIAVTLFKDFTTGLYQITVFFNKTMVTKGLPDGESKRVSSLKLLYNCDYKIVINDAESILLDYDLCKRININNLKCLEFKIEYAKQVLLKEDEIGSPIIIRDGKMYLIPGNKAWLTSAHYDEGWKPASNKITDIPNEDIGEVKNYYINDDGHLVDD